MVEGQYSSVEPIEQVRLILANIPVIAIINRGQLAPRIVFDDANGAASTLAAETASAPAIEVIQALIDRLAAGA